AYEKMTLQSNDWFIDAELILNCINLNLRIYEIPVEFHSLGARKSFGQPDAILEFLRHMIDYRRRWSPQAGKSKRWQLCLLPVAALSLDRMSCRDSCHGCESSPWFTVVRSISREPKRNCCTEGW